MPDANLYSPPQSSLEGAPTSRPRATKLAKAGAWIQIAPLLGIIGTILGMIRAFSAQLADGIGNPSKLAAAIGEVLVSSALGFWGGMIGFVCLGVAVFGQRNQPRWAKVIFWLSVLPTLIGASMLVMIILSALRGGVE